MEKDPWSQESAGKPVPPASGGAPGCGLSDADGAARLHLLIEEALADFDSTASGSVTRLKVAQLVEPVRLPRAWAKKAV